MKKFCVYLLLLILIPSGFSSGSIFDMDARVRNLERRRVDYALGLFGGLNTSKFVFTNSSGQKDKNYDYVNGINFGINLIISSGFNQFRPEISFHKGGAKNISNSKPINWETSYISANIGYLLNVIRSRYDFWGAGNAAPYSIRIGASVGFNYMTNGVQSIGENKVSLIYTNAFSRFDVNASAIATFGIRLTNLLAFNVEYRFNYGLLQIEKISPTQKTHNLYHSFLLAIYHKLDW